MNKEIIIAECSFIHAHLQELYNRGNINKLTYTQFIKLLELIKNEINK
jgi:hypothetical protein